MIKIQFAIGISFFLILPNLFAETVTPPYSFAARHNNPVNVYWGDTHVHTLNSTDAGGFGVRLGPEDAYRFAKGEQLITTTGQPAKLARPLDFLVVADHSENMGFFARLLRGDPDILQNKTGKRWSEAIQQGGQTGIDAGNEIVFSFSTDKFPAELTAHPGSTAYTTAWHNMIQAADNAYAPGSFTAFIGYEWTSMPVGGKNLHRVLIYRDDAEKAKQMVPYTSAPPMGSADPKDLWQWMARYEEKTQGQILAIAHNGNVSNGLMFPEIDYFTKKPVDKDYVESRARWEPLYEATQIKGDGEAHPLLSPDDEFADFGTWDWGDLKFTEPKTDDMLPYEYARSALQLGLKLESSLGTNPYKFGMIGSTDSHTALATADTNNFFGKHPGNEPSADRLKRPWAVVNGVRLESWGMVSSGYAAVWATQNTREALFDAMMRKEVYATTGPRITVRFFGGWSFVEQDASSPDLAAIGYSKGVPMGGDLRNAPANQSPQFLVAASRDPIGASLDRIQIVKGWVNEKGERQEKVYDVVWSGQRVINNKGKLPPVGNTVDIKNASWSNSIGVAELMTVWQDPDFDPVQRAVYYARVLEIPTPNWPVYDAKYYNVDLPKEATLIHQERAYTSPIWYSPSD